MPEHVEYGPNVTMAGPIPLVAPEGNSRSRPFEQPGTVPPLDLDGLDAVFEHEALVSCSSLFR